LVLLIFWPFLFLLRQCVLLLQRVWLPCPFLLVVLFLQIGFPLQET
jgi:hypothetical protein